MNDPYLMSNYPKPPTREPQRPEGMQGPERHLVGESLRDSTKDAVEEAKLGRRDVGEIGGAIELRGHIAREIREAQLRASAARQRDDQKAVDFSDGEVTALIKLQEWVADTAGQRSDLSNESSSPTAGGGSGGAQTK